MSQGTDSSSGSKVHLDANTHWGALGVRLNLASENLRTQFDKADGTREFASLALATQVGDTKLSADLRNTTASNNPVPGLGLLDCNGDGVGDTCPHRSTAV